jgi:hypothetical protein
MKTEQLTKLKPGDKVVVLIEATIEGVDHGTDNMDASLCLDDGENDEGIGGYWIPNAAIKSIEKISEDSDDD